MGASSSSHAAHAPERIRERLAQPPAESVLGDVMLGGVDGVVTTFAVVAGSVGGSLPTKTVVILGVANLVADGFSMAASNYLGTRSRQQAVEMARADEVRQIETYPEGERREIEEIYASKGLDEQTLRRVVAQVTADRRVWVDTMLAEELRLSAAIVHPVQSALVTFIAFVLFGLLPLLPYLVGGLEEPVVPSALLSVVAFFALGAGKGLALKQRWATAGAVTLVVGGAAAGLAYTAGLLLQAAHIAGAQ